MIPGVAAMIASHPYPVPGYQVPTARGLSAQKLAYFLVWATMASSSVVFAEPALFDALMIGLIALLPLLGLTSFSNPILFFLFAWLVIGASELLSASLSGILDISTKHTLISIYLSLSAIILAAFVRADPERHIHIVMSGLMFASLVAVTAGVGGYFGAIPGMDDLFTQYGRARGLFKDPNVYGSFIVPALIYYLHGMATASAKRSLIMFLLAGFVVLGLLVSFSRGAWFNAAIAVTVYGYVQFIAAHTHRLRLKLVLIGVFGICTVILGLMAIMQIESVADLLKQRASLTQSYDTGTEGRFGGQLRALDIIITNPLGIGALEFARPRSSEDVHNVYLSMFLNAGWLGGMAYLGLVITTLAVAFRNALRPSPHQGMLIVLLASFAGMVAEGVIVDTDHWRHFYIIMGLIWSLIAARKYNIRRPQTISMT